MTLYARIPLQVMFFTGLSCAFLSCEKAELRETEPVVEMNLEDAPVYPPPVSDPGPAVEPAPDSGPSVEEKPEGTGEQPGEEKEVVEPEFRAFLEDEKIVLEGAFASRRQPERIESVMGEVFSGVRIENRIKYDEYRFPVGWANRVAEGFLVPYFQDIGNPSVEYKEGIVTLRGSGTGTQKRAYHELAGIVFQGMFSRDLKNEIEIIED